MSGRVRDLVTGPGPKPVAAQPPQPATPVGRAAMLVAATVAACGLLIVAGRALPAPPAEPDRWYGWWQDSGPVVAVFAAGRLLLIGLVGLWSLTLLGALALAFGRRARVPAWIRSGLAFPPVLRLALLLSASSGPLVACGTAATDAGEASPPAPVLYNLTTPAAAAAPTGQAAASPGTATGAPRDQPGGRVAAGGGHRRTAPLPRRTPAAGAAPSVASPDAAAAAGHSQVPAAVTPEMAAVHPAGPVPGQPWVIQPGDDLWNLATRALGAGPGREATTEVGPYWLRVIEANRDRLPDPADPSLLFPGDTILLPAR